MSRHVKMMMLDTCPHCKRAFELMDELKADHELVITLEDGVLDGGFGEKIARYYGATDIKVLNYGAKKEFVDRYDIQELLRANHLTDEQIVEDILSLIG